MPIAKTNTRQIKSIAQRMPIPRATRCSAHPPGNITHSSQESGYADHHTDGNRQENGRDHQRDDNSMRDQRLLHGLVLLSFLSLLIGRVGVKVVGDLDLRFA